LTVFVDTSAFLAIFAADDAFHDAARTTWRALIVEEERLVCNNYILIETFTLLQRRLGMAAARSFQSDVLPSLNIHWVDEQVHGRAMTALLAADQRYLSLVDCSAFETMRLYGITQSFTFDQHFADHGFEVLPR
jgi:predicted nucleic acid-binding protein